MDYGNFRLYGPINNDMTIHYYCGFMYMDKDKEFDSTFFSQVFLNLTYLL